MRVRPVNLVTLFLISTYKIGGESVTTLIETDNLSITFGGHTAVDSVSISVPEKHFKSIIGPNGAG